MKRIAILFIGFLVFFNTLVLGADYERELNHCLVQARISYDNLRYPEAIEWWQKALKIDPKNPEALKYIKRAQERLNAGIISEEILIKPRAIKEMADKKIRQGDIYYRNYKYDLAIKEWEQALAIDPANVDVVVYIQNAEAAIKARSAGKAAAAPEEKKAEIKKSFREESPPIFEKPSKDTLTLEDALAVGLKNHLPVQIAREQVNLARFKEKEAFRELFPAANVKWDESTGRVNDRDYKGRKYQLNMQQPLYRGGKLRATWEQSKVNLKIASENYAKTKEEYTIELAKAYYDLVKAINTLGIQDKLLKELDKDLAMSKKEFEAAVSTLIEFLNVQSQYNQAYYAYLSAENTMSLAKSNFLQLLNLDRDPTVNINIDSRLTFKDQNVDLESCIRLAYDNRTDLKINELGLKAAEYGEKIARSQQLPNIDLNGNIGKGGETYTPGSIEMSDSWFVGAKVTVPWGPNSMDYAFSDDKAPPSVSSWAPTSTKTHSLGFNLFDKLGTYTEAKQGEITYEQAYADLIKGKQTAAAQVREAYFNYQESVLKLKNSRANKELYEKELLIVKQKRQLNEAQTQDVVLAKVKLASEEVNYNSALTDSFLAVAKLNKAIGIKDYLK